MKKQIIIAVCLLAMSMSSCVKNASTSSVTPTNPVSTFNITFNGKTFNVTTGDKVSSVSAITETQSAAGGSTWFTELVEASNTNIDASIFGQKADISTAVGSYNVSGNPSSGSMLGLVTIEDYTDGGKTYTCQDNTASSSVTISISNSSEIKGTFSILLSYNGTNYPATGDFDFKH